MGFPFYFEGKELTYDKTIKLFTDKFGEFGPANWVYGEFPDGEENFPVQGISWFEARAYAKYKGLSLPNIFQWLDAANLSGYKFKLPNLVVRILIQINLEMLQNLIMKLTYYQT